VDHPHRHRHLLDPHPFGWGVERAVARHHQRPDVRPREQDRGHPDSGVVSNRAGWLRLPCPLFVEPKMSASTSPLWGRTGVKSPLWGLGGSSSPLWGRLGVNSMFSPWGDRGVIRSLRAHSHYEYTPLLLQEVCLRDKYL
jgi:hypothetical protein